jgi:ABC-type lipoprotein export system ATPase subunit
VIEHVVRCVDVARTFGHGRNAIVAVHGINCIVPVGASVALLGRSGSGKSTLLHLMAGVDEPTRGSVTWPALGRRQTLRPWHIGMVFQTPNLLPALDVTDNVALPLLLAGERAAEGRLRAEQLLARLDLACIGNKLPEDLSGGQAQRVAIARALVMRPQFVLADEPTGQLDHVSATHVLDALLEVAADAQASVVIATHDRGVAAHLKIAWRMQDGELLDADCAVRSA